MPLDRLVADLEESAAREMAAHYAAAQARADAIRAESDAAAAARRRRFFAEHQPGMQGQVRRQIARVRHENAEAVLRAREALLERVFAKATELLAAEWALDAYARGLATHLERVLAYLDDRTATIRCQPAIADAVRSLLQVRPGLTVEVEADPTAAPGLVLQTADGRLVIDDTLDARLTRLRPSLASRLIGRLDGRA